MTEVLSRETGGRTALGSWCGGVLILVVGLAAPLAWLGPLGFAPVMALAGLLCLPALRLKRDDAPFILGLTALVAWAVVSATWSPYIPKSLDERSALKLPLEAFTYLACVAGAREAAARLRIAALRLLVAAMALLGAILIVEAMTGAGLYQAIRIMTGDGIRADLAVKNVAQGVVVLALLAPAALAAAFRLGGWQIALPLIVGGVIGPALAFGSDAPLVALVAGCGAGALVWRAPKRGPQVLATIAASFFLFTPALVAVARAAGGFAWLEARVSPSWAQRMGYWRHASDWISDHPLRGWGLDASRMFAPGIRLHPHDAALQIWLELGGVGGIVAASLWGIILLGLRRPDRDPRAAAAGGTAFAYLTFNAFSFGVWQEWWLALGGLAATLCVLLIRTPAQGQRPAMEPPPAPIDEGPLWPRRPDPQQP